jgi:parallel beta-helix repeat protein
MKNNVILTGILFILCILVALIGYTHPDITLTLTPTSIIVNPGQNIQSAITSAPAGTNIIVNPGNYSENLKIYKNITLIANGTVNIQQINIAYTQCTVKGFRLSGDYPLVISNTRDVKIIGNTITSNLNGIMSTGKNVNLLITSNTLIGTNPFYGNNMAFEGPLYNSTVQYNVLSGAEFGMLYDTPSTNITIENNVITGSYSLENPRDPLVHTGTGIYTVAGSTNFKILNNTVIDSRDSIAVEDLGGGLSTGFLIENNTVIKSFNGVWATISNSLIQNNNFSNNVAGIDIVGTGNTIKNNNIENNSVVGIALTTKQTDDYNILINNTLTGNGGPYYTVGPGRVVM